jgi:hypothetical protein
VRGLVPGDRRTGELLAQATIDAHFALLVEDGILTGDPEALEHLIEARGIDARLVAT